MSSNMCKELAADRHTKPKFLQSLCKTRDKEFAAENIFRKDYFLSGFGISELIPIAKQLLLWCSTNHFI